MAEKRVSVRLTATGGRQVRDELEGVGTAGRKAFERLPRDVERANAKLSAFARRVAVASAAAATAAAAAAVTATNAAMDRAFEVQRQAAVANADPQDFQGMAAGAQTVGIEQEKLADILKDVNDRVGDFLTTGGGPMADFFENIAPKVGVTADQFARLSGPEALQLYVSSLERAGASQQEMTFYLEAMASDATALLPLLRNNGAEMSRLAERAADLGLVMDDKTLASLNRARVAVVAVGQVMVGMGNKIGVALAPILEGLATSFVDLASSTGPLGKAINALTDNIGRILTYAGTFAALMAGKWVVGMGLAAAAVIRTAGALTVLKGALIRTGIGALIVGAGELVYWFSRLVTGAGGFGDAMGLLKNLVVVVWERIKMGASAAGAAATAMFYDIKSDAASGMASAIESVVGFGNTAVNTFQGTFFAVQAVFGALPDVFARIGVLSINKLVEAMEAGLAGITRGVNALLTIGGRFPEQALDPPDLSEWSRVVPQAVGIGGRAAEGFARGFETDLLQVPDLGLDDIAREALATANTYRGAAEDLARGATLPLASWQALRDAVSGADTEGEDALTGAAASAAVLTAELEDAETAATRAGAAARQAGTVAKEGGDEAAMGWRAVTQGLSQYADQAMDWGKGLSDTLVGAFRSAENAFRNFVKTGKLDFKGLVASILEDLAVLQFRKAVLGPIANALSSAFAGPDIGGSVTAAVSHTGGMVGLSGYTRSVPAMAFAGAPRMHAGGMAGLRPDEVPTILQRGERVLNRRETAQYSAGGGGMSRVRIELGDGLVGSIMERAGAQSVEIVQGSLQQYDRLIAPRTVARVSQDPRRSG